MSLSFFRQQLQRLTPVAIAFALLGSLAAGTAFARITQNTIDPVATVAAHGRQILVTGPIAITVGETAFLQVTVTQRSTGAVAAGLAFLTGTGEVQHWAVNAVGLSRESFAAGPATAVALARTTLRGSATDAHQWLVNITLVTE